MSIGTGNAESDDDLLFECFVTYPPVDEALKVGSAGMILAGRTGSGKTAIIRYVQQQQTHTSEIDPAEMSMSYVANSDALRFLHVIGADLPSIPSALEARSLPGIHPIAMGCR